MGDPTGNRQSSRPAVITVGDELVYAERENGNQAVDAAGPGPVQSAGWSGPSACRTTLTRSPTGWAGSSRVATTRSWSPAGSVAPMTTAPARGLPPDCSGRYDCTRNATPCSPRVTGRVTRHSVDAWRNYRRGAGCLPTRTGAPGFACDGVYAFPGFPMMLQPMLEAVLGELLPVPGAVPVSHDRVLAVAEGDIALAVEAFIGPPSRRPRSGSTRAATWPVRH